ncbi:unnamed protein product [Symbiodinium pilosum]|uniref:Uncharacterized protein n=1 Tax=Symbiodinium pilosum TaxID=2952 RepID=A0A812WAV4_SYMPI|nr:unnamed protein product [Symbiodinium pilosum]
MKHRGMGQICKTDREKDFPIEVFRSGIAIESSQCEDLGFGVYRPASRGRQTPTAALDSALNSFFAQSALAQLLHRRISISPFLDAIAAHTSQEELVLPCLSHALNDPQQFLADFSPKLSSLLQLRSLKLDFGWRSIYANSNISSLTSVADIGSGIRPLQQLEDLALRLSGCKNLKSLDGLDTALAQLTSLKSLELQFEACERLQSFSELGKSLGLLVNLTSLECSLGGCRKLVDADVRDLGKGIRNLSKLNRLKVDLSGAKHIFYMTELGRSVRFLRDLKHLELDVSLCTNLCDVSTLGNSLRMLLMETQNFQPHSGSVFALKLDKSGVRINREKVSGYDDPAIFVKSLGVRALCDPDEADLRPPSPKGRQAVWLTHLEEQDIKRSYQVPMGCQGLFKGCPRLY